MLKHGDILHYKAKGWHKLKAKFNPMRTAIFIEVLEQNLVAIFENNEIKLVQFFGWSNKHEYVSSRPEWVENPSIEIFQRLGMKFKNEHVLFAEIIGISDFHKCKQNDILKICIEKEWLQG